MATVLRGCPLYPVLGTDIMFRRTPIGRPLGLPSQGLVRAMEVYRRLEDPLQSYRYT